MLLRLLCYAAIAWWLYRRLRRGGVRRRPVRPARPPGESAEFCAACRRLGVAPGGTAAELRRAYRRLALKYHPDRLKCQGLDERQQAAAAREMAEINAAWQTIRSFRKV